MNIPKEHPQYETKRRNIAIALFLGWFKENGQPDTWYEILNTAQYVAYSEYSDLYKSLPFNRDWAWLMRAIEKIEKRGYQFENSIFCDMEGFFAKFFEINKTNFDLYPTSLHSYSAVSKIEAAFLSVSGFCIAWCEKNKPNELEKYLAA